jgi:hypothetical protein
VFFTPINLAGLDHNGQPEAPLIIATPAAERLLGRLGNKQIVLVIIQGMVLQFLLALALVFITSLMAMPCGV